jgi:quercetin dioxygenase-like cupin family protein
MMKVIKANSVAKEKAVGDLYVGGHIDFQHISGSSGDLDIYMVNFAPGARNHLHTHTMDQVLIATSGRGFVADAKGRHDLAPGDIVITSAGHAHWHGAVEGSSFSHLCITKQGDNITVLGGEENMLV